MLVTLGRWRPRGRRARGVRVRRRRHGTGGTRAADGGGAPARATPPDRRGAPAARSGLLARLVERVAATFEPTARPAPARGRRAAGAGVARRPRRRREVRPAQDRLRGPGGRDPPPVGGRRPVQIGVIGSCLRAGGSIAGVPLIAAGGDRRYPRLEQRHHRFSGTDLPLEFVAERAAQAIRDSRGETERSTARSYSVAAPHGCPRSPAPRWRRPTGRRWRGRWSAATSTTSSPWATTTG